MKPPELGADIRGRRGHVIRFARRFSMQADPASCMEERDTILEWAEENRVRLRQLDMVRERPSGDRGWQAFIEDDTQAVLFKTRWG